MMSNSLLLTYLKNIGLKVSLDGFTRDLISVDFSMGSSLYLDSKKRILNIIESEENEEKRENLNNILNFIEEHKDNFKKVSKEQIRKEYYENGITITYVTKTKRGLKEDTVHYKRLYRSTGQAKLGSCMFIRDELFDDAQNFIYMGLKMPEKDAKLVEIGAYSSLIASSNMGEITLNPKNVVVLDDTESSYFTNVISIEVGDDGHTTAIKKENYELTNIINDGMALIDKSVFPNWGLGYILLRQHMFKSAAFKTDLKLFFKEYFADKYDSAFIFDKWGNKHKVSEVQMITTTESCKWLKFDITYEQFCKSVNELNNQWGVVKTAHPSKHLKGSVQRMSYQMVNCLDLDTIRNVTKYSEDYIWKLKTDNEVFIEYLKDNSNFSNDYDVLVALIKHCGDEFMRTDYFLSRRSEIIKSFTKRFKSGKVFVEGADNLVMCGNPYALLLKSVGENPLDEGIFTSSKEYTECYTPRFLDGEYLAGFRSPHNGLNNILYLKNVYHPFLDRYFDLSEQCIVVNCIGSDIQSRANG